MFEPTQNITQQNQEGPASLDEKIEQLGVSQIADIVLTGATIASVCLAPATTCFGAAVGWFFEKSKVRLLNNEPTPSDLIKKPYLKAVSTGLSFMTLIFSPTIGSVSLGALAVTRLYAFDGPPQSRAAHTHLRTRKWKQRLNMEQAGA